MLPRVTHWCLLGLLCLPPLAAAADGTVECEGEANMVPGDVVATRKAAINDGLRECVEKVAGVFVQSEFTSEQQEALRQGQHESYLKVRDALLKKSEGFVQNYKVLDERRTAESLRVRLRATVFESKLRAEAKRLKELLAAAGNPKLMLLVQDVYVDVDGGERVDVVSVLGSLLEKELLARGIDLVAPAGKGRVALSTRAQLDALIGDPRAAAILARDAGADLLLVGRVEIFNRGEMENVGSLVALKGQTRVEIKSVLKGLNAATGELFASEPLQTTSIGTNEERAVHRAFRGQGANVVQRTFEPILADLKSSFERSASDGQSYVVQLRNVTSFRLQGRVFLDLLGGVSGVSRVNQKSFNNGDLEIDVACRCSPAELQDRIFNAVTTANDLKAIDIEGVSGKFLTFRL